MSLRDLYVPGYESTMLLRTDRANMYVVGTTEPKWKRRGMIWADTSASAPVIKMLQADGAWVDIANYRRDVTLVGSGASGSITSTADTNGHTITPSIAIPTNVNLWGQIEWISSGTGYGRVGLTLNSTSVNSPAADGTCLARDDATNRGGTCFFFLPRRDTTFTGDFGTCWAARIGVANSIVRLGLSNDPPAVAYTSISLRGSVSAASTQMSCRWSVYSWVD